MYYHLGDWTVLLIRPQGEFFILGFAAPSKTVVLKGLVDIFCENNVVRAILTELIVVAGVGQCHGSYSRPARAQLSKHDA